MKIAVKKRKRAFFLSLACVLILVSDETFACRFWVAVGEHVPQDKLIGELIEAEHSLKRLGGEYADGWSLSYYENREAIVYRGSAAANIDQNFDYSVTDVAELHPSIVLGHLRRASSGCVDGVPNPHPFERVKNGTTWLFGHNGGMKKSMLVGMIGKAYLDVNPPETCSFDPPDSWIDSELYFIYLLKEIEKNEWNVVDGLKKSLEKLKRNIDEERQLLNFFLSDGQTVWVFRKGNTLFWHYDDKSKLTTVSSDIPQKEQGQWQEFPEDNIAVLYADKHPEFIPLSM